MIIHERLKEEGTIITEGIPLYLEERYDKYLVR